LYQNFVILDMENDGIADMAQLGILESFHLKSQVVISAAEAAEMVLRIDNIIRAPPRPRQRDMRHH
jgi:T-complex protein 1 subunit beta